LREVAKSTAESSDDVRPGVEQGAVAAFFDLDNTLLSPASGRLFLRWLYGSGRLPLHRWVYILRQVALYITGVVDFTRLMARLTVHVAGYSEAEAWRMSNTWFETTLQYAIASGGRRQIDWHRGLGHHVAIVSAATPYAVKPVARALGLGDAFLATDLEVIGGRFTGRVREPACFGAGKATRTLTYAATRKIDLKASYFYSDSASDLPLLEIVGHPVAVNPSRKLARIAGQRSWPIMKFY
jgi:putative phosphoserine phosphatase/1-acylglycerol-3-phosphate O-acyltransferase